MSYPKPDGWQGGSDDFECVFTLYGENAIEVYEADEPDLTRNSDTKWRRNAGRHSTKLSDGGLGTSPYEP